MSAMIDALLMLTKPDDLLMIYLCLLILMHLLMLIQRSHGF